MESAVLLLDAKPHSPAGANSGTQSYARTQLAFSKSARPGSFAVIAVFQSVQDLGDSCSADTPKGRFSAGVVEGLNNEAKVTMRKSYGFRTPETLELALYHNLAKLPEPNSTHTFW